MLQRLTQSIQAKLVLGFTVPFVILVLFAAIYYPLNERDMTLESAREQARMLSEMVALSVGTGLADSNYDLVQQTFNWAVENPNVRYVAILDENDEMLFDHNPNDMQLDQSRLLNAEAMVSEGGLLRTAKSIEYKGTSYGHVVLAYSLKETMAEVWSNVVIAIIVNLLILGGGIAAVLWLSRRIAGRIKRLCEGAETVSEGNLDVEVEVDAEDELGELARGFNEMVSDIRAARQELEEGQKKVLEDNVALMLEQMNRFAKGDLTVAVPEDRDGAIGDLFSGFNRAVSNVRSMLYKVHEAVTTAVLTADEVSESTEQMASGAQEQSAQADEVAAAVEQMSRTIISNAETATQTADVAEKNGQTAQENGQVILETVSKMKEIGRVIADSAETVNQLGRRSQEIGEIVSTIDEIADQTNLLALNAAIEAARAGDHGKGFAVVADEVRQLAERTAKATDEIDAMITSIQDETEAAVTAIQAGHEEVEVGIELAGEAGEAFKGIVEGTVDVTERVGSIAVSTEQQSATSEQISCSVEAISTVADQQAQNASEIARVISEMSAVTSRSQALIAKFKIEEGSTADLHHGVANADEPAAARRGAKTSNGTSAAW